MITNLHGRSRCQTPRFIADFSFGLNSKSIRLALPEDSTRSCRRQMAFAFRPSLLILDDTTTSTGPMASRS